MNDHQKINKKLEPLNKVLENRFGLRIEYNSQDDLQHLCEVRQNYTDKKNFLMMSLGESAAMKSPDYAKCLLISEAVRMILKEIQPKRRKKSRNKETSK